MHPALVLKSPGRLEGEVELLRARMRRRARIERADRSSSPPPPGILGDEHRPRLRTRTLIWCVALGYFIKLSTGHHVCESGGCNPCFCKTLRSRARKKL